MRILIINQFFWPDVAPTGQYLSDLARHLAAEDHQVTVICGKDAYGQAEDDGLPPPPVEILRVNGLPFKRTGLSRMLSYFTFLSGALWLGVRASHPDMVLTMTTPPMLAVVGHLLKMVHKTRHFIWEMDVFPDALVTTGTMPAKSLVVRLLSSIQRFARNHSDGLIALGPCMRDRLIQAGTPAHLIHIAENWADSQVISAMLPVSDGNFHLLYSGNLGKAHDIGTIADAIRYFRNNSTLTFSFAGGGSGRDRVKELSINENIRNVKFPGYAKRSEMSHHLAQATVGLVTELAACSGTVVPSKVYGLMAAGRPFLFIGPAEATPSLIIREFDCGWQIDPGDSLGLISLLERLLVHRDEVIRKGANALTAFRQYYDLPIGVARVSAALGLNQSHLATVQQPELVAEPDLSIVQ